MDFAVNGMHPIRSEKQRRIEQPFPFPLQCANHHPNFPVGTEAHQLTHTGSVNGFCHFHRFLAALKTVSRQGAFRENEQLSPLPNRFVCPTKHLLAILCHHPQLRLHLNDRYYHFVRHRIHP